MTKNFLLIFILFIFNNNLIGGYARREAKKRIQYENIRAEEYKNLINKFESERNWEIYTSCSCVNNYYSTIKKKFNNLNELKYVWTKNDSMLFKFYKTLKIEGYKLEVINYNLLLIDSNDKDIKNDLNKKYKQEYIKFSFDSFKNLFKICQDKKLPLYNDSNYKKLPIIDRIDIFNNFIGSDTDYIYLNDSLKAFFRRQYYIEKPYGIIDTAYENKLNYHESFPIIFKRKYTIILEFIYNNRGKLLIYSILILIMIEFLNDYISYRLKIVIQFFSTLVIIFILIFNYFYCGESCMKEKAIRLKYYKEKKREKEHSRKQLLEECEEEGGDGICECCDGCMYNGEHDCGCEEEPPFTFRYR
jgi:hypothetical protein